MPADVNRDENISLDPPPAAFRFPSRRPAWSCFLLIFLMVSHIASAREGPTIEVAVLPFFVSGELSNADRACETSLEDGLRTAGVSVTPRNVMSPVLSARATEFRPETATNMRVEEARATGAALGCDFFVVGKATVAERSGTDRKAYVEGRADLFLVDSRTGRLVEWKAVTTHENSVERAAHALRSSLREDGEKIVSMLTEFRRGQQTASEASEDDSDLLDLRDGVVPEGVVQAKFVKRPRPALTDAAREAGVEARVEVDLILDKSGKVRVAQIVRWAGYDLEDAVLTAIRGYVVEPAKRDGAPVGVRFIAEYNFRRVSE